MAPRTTRRLVVGALTSVLVLSACSSDDPDAASPAVTTAAAVTATPTTDVVVATTESAVAATEPPATTDSPATSAPTTAEPTDTAPPATDSADATEPELVGVITDVVADAQGGRSLFDGEVDELSDLDDLVSDAWGDGGLGIHRGHAQIENVLEAFLGIDHDQMHEYMDAGFNLAALSEEMGLQADALVETLTFSYAPFVEAGVDNGVISEAEAVDWIDAIRTEFSNRVYWQG